MPKIEHIYAYIAADKGPNDEGVAAFKVGTTWLPMVAADEKRVESLKEAAQRLASEIGKPIHLVKFSRRENIAVIHPK